MSVAPVACNVTLLRRRRLGFSRAITFVRDYAVAAWKGGADGTIVGRIGDNCPGANLQRLHRSRARRRMRLGGSQVLRSVPAFSGGCPRDPVGAERRYPR